ncbi:hypothetical protein MVEN_02033800 [Mycena venus]|uniref:Uncharacterized protein n=1 Tax=Mycena venus TaxID=2733690 RepID=A0A8H6XBN2_9AGAR|nr:hypothetical protein MVEN_02033800 [Mycena venus]
MSSTDAMSSSASPSQNSALYQYAVPAAVFIFAAISITVYFRSSIRRQSPTGIGAVVALRGQQGAPHLFDPRMKPPLFEAYLVLDGADGGQRQFEWDAEAQAPVPSGEWADIMPLSVANIITGAQGAAARAAKRASAASPSPSPEVDPRPPDANANASTDAANLNHSSSAASLGLNSDLVRALVSVVVRMPVAPTPEAAPTAERVDGAGDAEDMAEDDIGGAPLPYLELGLVEVDVLGAGDSSQGVTS